MNISYSFGIMDLFHYGHLRALEKAKNKADLHVCGLLSDMAAKAWGGSVVSNEEERRSVLEGIRCIDWVMPQKTLDPTENLKKLHYIYPDAVITLFRGDDIAVLAASAYLKRIGGRVEFLDYYERLSPTAIWETLNQRTEKLERHVGMVSTKANTLLALQDRVKCSRIEPMFIITAGEFLAEPENMAERVRKKFSGGRIVVRSSSQKEDSFDTSNAGHYESVLSVNSGNADDVRRAVGEVYASYAKDGKVDDDEQILVQAQTENVKYSGVVFTRDIQRNRPYYIVNYDDSGATDSVTGGMGGEIIWIAHDIAEDAVPKEWKPLFAAVRELENILRGMLLDIEFAVNEAGEVILFQVRPLAASYKFGRSHSPEQILKRKGKVRDLYQKRFSPMEDDMLSDMAFWNPAEMIGDNPRPLDYSLYREIITHRAWNEGLVPMGYSEVAEDLMCRLGNKPYISLRKAFRSLIPEELPKALRQKLEAFYIAELRRDISAHDKIEFEIALSCYDFSTEKRLCSLWQKGFSEEETKSLGYSLKRLTQTTIANYSSILHADCNALEQLEKIRRDIEEKCTKTTKINELAMLVEELLVAIKRYGTPQFARQARAAFIAKSLVESLRTEGYWSKETYDSFMQNLHTVTADFEKDFSHLLDGRMSRQDFNEKYGHLRAGTYDITASRYDQMTFTEETRQAVKELVMPCTTDAVPEKMDDILEKQGLQISSDVLFDFLRQSMEQRERFKYVFTKSLSRILEMVANVGEKLGISRAEMAYADILDILALRFYDTEEMAADYLRGVIADKKEKHKLYSQLILPSVVTDVADLDFIQMENARPNYITEQIVDGETVLLEGNVNQVVTGKIVLVEKADPGYDWVFAHGIKGLITRYGGVASHMAIRCAEFGIPAAIGCGKQLFSFAKRQERLVIDAKHETIRKG